MFILIVFLFAVSETTLSKEGIRGSRLEVTLEYTRLKSYEVSSRTDEQEFLEKYEKPEEDSEGKVNSEYDIGRNLTNHPGILYELSMPSWGSVPDRFYGIRDFPYLKLGFRDLKLKWAEIRDWKCTREVGFKNNHRDYGNNKLADVMCSVSCCCGCGRRDCEVRGRGWLHEGDLT